MPLDLALIDSKGVILLLNASWRKHAAAGMPTAALNVGDNYLRSYDSIGEAGSSRAIEAAAGVRAVLLGELREFVIDYPRKSLTQLQWFRLTVTPIEHSRSRGAMVMQVDISSSKTSEQKLQEQATQYLTLLNSATEGIFALEERGICTFCNRAAARLLGYEKASDLVGTARSFGECKINQAILSGKIVHADNELFVRVNGTQFPVEYWSRPIHNDLDMVGTVVTFFDLTEQRRLESDLLHAQKIEVFGHLAGGIVHDFNNALALITGYSQLLEERLGADEGSRNYARQIGVAAERAASFTRQLLCLNRKESPKPVLLSLNSVVMGLQDLLSRMIGKGVKLTVVLAPTLPLIRTDLGMIEQILLNLIANARDAMPQGGNLVIETLAVGDGYVALTISDSGSGMDQATQDRIFEPFFTTKGPGEGTGLGLSTVQKIVKQSGGQIFVHSELGVGTTFHIYLPIVSGIPAPILLPQPAHGGLRGSETILVIEDQGSLRALVSDALRANGYIVLEAQDGASGAEVAEHSHKPIDLVITDATLTDINGVRVAERLLETNRSLEVLYMSGYSDDYIANTSVVLPEMTFLEKPFDLGAMLLAVRKALDRKPASLLTPRLQSTPFLIA